MSVSESDPTNQSASNVTLIGCLTLLGWSPEQFASHLNGLARSLRLPDEIHPKTPRRWLTARPPHVRPCVPRQPWPGLVCALLSMYRTRQAGPRRLWNEVEQLHEQWTALGRPAYHRFGLTVGADSQTLLWLDHPDSQGCFTITS